jgi:N-hydroxyarylamine O-acetyltransferase
MERNNWVGDFDFDLQLYLRRIGHVPEVEPTIECLKILHFHQLHTIPFENFDIQLNRSIDLTPEVQFRKLIFDSRGGYCFELNGLFLAAIRKAGFDARPLLGRVHVTGEVTGRGHQISLITIDNEPWIADVGFGADTPRCPFPLKINAPITSGAQTIQIIESKERNLDRLI